VLGDGEEDDGSSDRRSPAMKVWTSTNYGLTRSFSKWW
jgi:hypothetical protein